MAINFPTSLDTFSDPTPTSEMSNPSHSGLHVDINSAVEALEARVGVTNSTVATSLTYRINELEDGGAYATTATSGGTLTLTNTSARRQFFTGSTTHTVVLPVASTLAVGHTFEIHNNSTGALTINSSGGNLVATLNANATISIVCILASGTTASSWAADFIGATSITGSGNLVFSASPTFTGQVTVPAGSSSAAPLIFQSGAVLTSAAGGRMEYDGKVFYLTPSSTAVGGRGAIPAAHYFALSSNRTLSDVNTAQSIFGVGLTVQASTAYEIEMLFSVSSTGINPQSLGIGFAGTATLTSIGYQVSGTQNGTSLATLTTPNNAFIATASNTTVIASAMNATYRNVAVKGIVRVNATGTFIPQLTYSAAPGAAPVVAANSYIRMTPFGSDTVTNVGAWA